MYYIIDKQNVVRKPST